MKEFVFLVIFHLSSVTGEYHVGGTIGPLGDGKGDPIEMMEFCKEYKRDLLDVRKKTLPDPNKLIFECISATERPKNTIPDEED